MSFVGLYCVRVNCNPCRDLKHLVIRTAENFRQPLEEACVNGKDDIKVVLKRYRGADGFVLIKTGFNGGLL